MIKAAYAEPIPGLYDGLVDPRKILAQRLMKISDKRKIPSLLEFSKRMKIPDLFDPTKFVFYDPKSDRAQELWLMMLDDNKYEYCRCRIIKCFSSLSILICYSLKFIITVNFY